MTLLFPSNEIDSSDCHNDSRRKSKIIFKCGPSRGRPLFLEENDPCSYTFIWETDLVCSDADPSITEVPCYVETDNGEIVDLSPLVSSVMNWKALDEGNQYTATDQYYLSVCRPLVRTEDLPKGCNTESSGACQQQTDKSSPPLSLGMPTSPQYKSGEILMTYEFGDKCAETDIPNKAQIFFTCPASVDKGLGSPKFRGKINCVSIFDWDTTAACPIVTRHSSSCRVVDENDNEFDVSVLKNIKYKVMLRNERYDFGVCGSIIKCGDSSASAVCRTDLKDSSKNKATVLATKTTGVTVTDGQVMVSYESANDDHAVTVITTFVCNPSAEPNSQESMLASIIGVNYDSGILKSLVFEVETSVVCFSSIECAVEADGLSYDLSVLAKKTYWRVDTGLFHRTSLL